MPYQVIKVELDHPSAVLIMNRPEKYNALSKQLMGELTEALLELEQDPQVRGIIITGGSDKFFSTGADLNEAVAVEAPQETADYNRVWRRLCWVIENLRKPVIAAISGYCITGGCEMAMACDIRLCADNAQFAITSARIGSVAGAGGTQRLPRLVGIAKAKELLFTTDFIDAAEAARVGLVNRVVPVGRVVEEAKELVQNIAQKAPLSIWWAKVAVNYGMQMDMESALELEAQLSGRAFATQDKEEGMQAFLKKREAHFKGR